MRVLIINTVRFKLNGISAVIMNYYKAMNKDGISMEFVAIDIPSPEYQSEFNELGIICHVVKKKNVLGYFRNLYGIAQKGHFDIVHIHGNSASMAIELLACALAGIKVRIAHSHNTSTMHPVLHKILHPLFRFTYTQGFACGKDAGRWLFGNRPFTEIRNGIDLSRFKYSAEVRETYRRKINAGNRIVIGHVGNFIEQKNHNFLIEMFAALVKEKPDYLLLLVSDGYLMESMKQKAIELGIECNVIFLGKTQEVEKYMLAMDMFVLPSLHEGLPLVLVEAQASGLNCLVADTVAKEADLTNSIKFLPISSTEPWVRTIEKTGIDNSARESRAEKWQTEISNAGYDIVQNANVMRDLYLSYIDE